MNSIDVLKEITKIKKRTWHSNKSILCSKRFTKNSSKKKEKNLGIRERKCQMNLRRNVQNLTEERNFQKNIKKMLDNHY